MVKVMKMKWKNDDTKNLRGNPSEKGKKQRDKRSN